MWAGSSTDTTTRQAAILVTEHPFHVAFQPQGCLLIGYRYGRWVIGDDSLRGTNFEVICNNKDNHKKIFGPVSTEETNDNLYFDIYFDIRVLLKFWKKNKLDMEEIGKCKCFICVLTKPYEGMQTSNEINTRTWL